MHPYPSAYFILDVWTASLVLQASKYNRRKVLIVKAHYRRVRSIHERDDELEDISHVIEAFCFQRGGLDAKL